MRLFFVHHVYILQHIENLVKSQLHLLHGCGFANNFNSNFFAFATDFVRVQQDLHLNPIKFQM